MTTCWQLVRTFAVRFIKTFGEELTSLYLPRRAKKSNVGDLGDCGGDLRGARGVGELGDEKSWSAIAHGHSPPATDVGYDILRLVLLAEAYTSGQLPDIKRIDMASGVVLDPDIGCL